MASSADERRRSVVRGLGVLAFVVGVLVVVAGFYDFATARPEDGAPLGFFLLPVGGVIALIGLGLVSKSFGPVSSAFTEDELKRHRHGPRDE
jgi:hypothetical protein